MKKIPAFFLILFLSPLVLHARDPQFNTLNLKPAADSGKYFGVYGTEMTGAREFVFGFTSDYAEKPVGFFNAAGVKTQNIIERTWSHHLTGAYGFSKWTDAGILLTYVPLLVFRPLDNTATAVDESATSDTRVRMSDIQLNARLRGWELDRETDPVRVAFIPTITLPTGSGGSLVGNNQFAGGAMLAVESFPFLDRFTVALNLGYEIRKRAVLSTGTVVNDIFHYGIGAHLSVHPLVALMSELRGFTMVGDFFGAQRPMEWNGGARYSPIKDWAFTLGIGTGVIEGIGNPTFRFITGIAYLPEKKKGSHP